MPHRSRPSALPSIAPPGSLQPTDMNAADLIDRLSGSVAQYPLVALLVAVAGGIFSTST